MLHKIRNSFPNLDKFFRDIEIDETYVAAKEKNKHYNKKQKELSNDIGVPISLLVQKIKGGI